MFIERVIIHWEVCLNRLWTCYYMAFLIRNRRWEVVQWIYLCLAILFEVAGTTAMKLSDGLTKLCTKHSYFLYFM